MGDRVALHREGHGEVRFPFFPCCVHFPSKKSEADHPVPGAEVFARFKGQCFLGLAECLEKFTDGCTPLVQPVERYTLGATVIPVDVIGEQVKEPWDITAKESFERTLDARTAE